MPKAFLCTKRNRESEERTEDGDYVSDVDVVNEDLPSSDEECKVNVLKTPITLVPSGSCDSSSLSKSSFKSSKNSAFSKISILAQSSVKTDNKPRHSSDEDVKRRRQNIWDKPIYVEQSCIPRYHVPHPASQSSLAHGLRNNPQNLMAMFPYLDPRYSVTHYYKNIHKIMHERHAETLSVIPSSDCHLTGNNDLSVKPLHISVSQESCNIFEGNNLRKKIIETQVTPSITPRKQESTSRNTIRSSENLSSVTPTSSSRMINDQTTPEHQGLRFSAPAAPTFGLSCLEPAIRSPSFQQMPIPVPFGADLMYNPYQSLSNAKLRDSSKPPQIKKYKCDICSKAFSRSNTLVTHKRIHTGEKPFKCEVCNRAFRQPGNLTRHRLTHTTIKPYVCTHCHKAFNRASNLQTHMRTHTTFRPYRCHLCGQGFHQKLDLKIHVYTHTGEVPFHMSLTGVAADQVSSM